MLLQNQIIYIYSALFELEGLHKSSRFLCVFVCLFLFVLFCLFFVFVVFSPFLLRCGV